MSKIISIHSFRGGTGKSNTTANIATLLAISGQRVGVVDTDISSPGIHVLFGVNVDEMGFTLNDYLWGKCTINQAAHDMSDRLGQPIKGKLFLIPSSMKPGEISRVLKEGYDVGILNDGFNKIIDDLKLDALMIDTHPGLNEETLLSIAISDALVIIMRPDSQDYQGTSVTIDVARKLDVPRLLLMINKVPSVFDTAATKKRAEDVYKCEVAAVLPHSDDMMALASAGLFVLRFPDHPITRMYRQVVERLMAPESG
ncbi:MAG TPA: MinD/ParA family protein [Anaerolineae bacterium]|nr:MinD/ParA family protein [Anaerolineae bacterium]